jgi:hypothetical protein
VTDLGGLFPLVHEKTLMMKMSLLGKKCHFRHQGFMSSLTTWMTVTQNYAEEMAEIHHHIKREVVQLPAGVPGITRNDEVDQPMTANEIFNAIFYTTLVYEFIAMMNLWLLQHNCEPMDYNEFQIIIQLIFGFVTMGKDPVYCMVLDGKGAR